MSFAYIWEYQVKQDQTEAFRRIYGPDGKWVRLFLLFSVTLPLRDTGAFVGDPCFSGKHLALGAPSRNDLPLFIHPETPEAPFFWMLRGFSIAAPL